MGSCAKLGLVVAVSVKNEIKLAQANVAQAVVSALCMMVGRIIATCCALLQLGLVQLSLCWLSIGFSEKCMSNGRSMDAMSYPAVICSARNIVQT